MVDKFMSKIKKLVIGRNKKQESTGERWMKCILPDTVCIDCGANVGSVTEKMVLRGAIVYAFEPNPYAFRELEERFRGNENVFCINKAAWDRNSKLKLFCHERSDEDEVKCQQALEKGPPTGTLDVLKRDHPEMRKSV